MFPPVSLSAVPIQEAGVHVVDMEYSPLVGGFATVLSDGRAAFLTASSLKFDPNVSSQRGRGTGSWSLTTRINGADKRN